MLRAFILKGYKMKYSNNSLISCLIFFVSLALFSCQEKAVEESSLQKNKDSFISAVDISSYPEIAASGAVFYDLEGRQKDFLGILKEHGVNTVRLRLWVNPENTFYGFDKVKAFSESLKAEGFKVWLTVHYSDTWADPGHQKTPQQWQELSISDLKEQVYLYTEKIVTDIKPDYIQIGNEINNGFLHPKGHFDIHFQNFRELMTQAIQAVRSSREETQIMLHFAGIEGSKWFFDKVSDLDYDIIGLSYYPKWHGKSLDNLGTTLSALTQSFNKPVMVAETAYPFTLGWNDWTNNIIGGEDQLILPDFPATPQGQKDFINAVKQVVLNTEKGIGICYWGAELIAWKGDKAKDGSPWENQALFDFDNKALPVVEVFEDE